MSAGTWIGEAEVKSKHQGHVDEEQQRAICSDRCGWKGPVREIRLEAINDLYDHYRKIGGLTRYVCWTYNKERRAA